MRLIALFRCLCFIIPAMVPFASARGGELSIAAAADLTWCLEELDGAFQKNHPDATLKTAVGSSGNFSAQIANGAPFEVFLSADISYPQELVKSGFANPASLTRYAVGRIVLWTTVEKLDTSSGLEILRDPAVVKKLAIANPEHAPYGRAAKAALEHYGLWKSLEVRIVMGENISQTAQFVQTGNADAGIVALSLVLSPKLAGVGHYNVIPEEAYPPLDQAAVLTNAGMANPLAKSYMEFLRSDEARKIFDRYGFRLGK